MSRRSSFGSVWRDIGNERRGRFGGREREWGGRRGIDGERKPKAKGGCGLIVDGMRYLVKPWGD